ncbi:MAG TPA: cation:proton antiporter, partial [Actinomycetes bacterium]|nr:cation:proton antiporter [Actinomycetes bacterium]
FSIVIAGLAVAAGREAELGPLATAYVLILAVLGPVLARTSEPLRITLGRPLTALAGRRSARPPAGEMRPREP